MNALFSKNSYTNVFIIKSAMDNQWLINKLKIILLLQASKHV